MNFSVMKKLLTNRFRFKPDDTEYRRVYLLNSILLLFIGVAVIFAVLNGFIGHYVETVIELTAGVLCLATLIVFHKTDRLDLCCYAVAAIMFCMMAAMYADAGQVHYIFAWVCVFPPLLFFLLGSKKGLITSLIILAYLAVFMAVRFKNWGPADFGVISIVNILGSAISLILLIGYYELSRHEAASAVRLKNTELEQANRALSRGREQLRLILDSTAEAIFGVDMEARCTFCNASCLEMLGLKSQDELLGKDMHDLIHDRRKDGSPLPRSECDIIRTCMEGIAIHAEDEIFWRPGGTYFDVEYNSYPQYKDGELVGAVVTFIDNTLKKIHEQQIEYFGAHDSLTGLLNRSYFESMINKIDNKNNLPISIIMGDLNGLKLTNDIFGHRAGDELLIKTAEVLKKVCRGDDIVARIGGDEFVIILPKTGETDAMQIVSRINDVISKERVSAIRCSMSLGCDTKTGALQNIDLTMKNAENEMYKEKSLNRGKVNADMINAIIMSLYSRSPREEQHSTQVSELCKAIGEALELPDTEIAQLRSAGFLHDIGKIGVDCGILNKQDVYTEEEEMEYRQHPIIGYRLLTLFDNTLNLAESVYSHHERWDGTGYPRELKGSEIPLMARIIAVAGWYDTLLNYDNGYPFSREQALEELQKESGARLDPHIVSVFISLMDGA